MAQVPQILISIRNSEEVADAMAAADILDVKDPSRGSLGMAAPDTLLSIRQRLDEAPSGRPLSIAAGELGDWFGRNSHSDPHRTMVLRDSVQDLREVVASCRPQFLKVGLTGVEDWRRLWNELRQAVPGHHEWVAVSYADWKKCSAPPLRDVLTEATRCGLKTFLIDTFLKDGTCLLDLLSTEELGQITGLCRQARLRLALAGQLTLDRIDGLRLCNPDVIAVRGAVCGEGRRIGQVERARALQLRSRVQATFSDSH